MKTTDRPDEGKASPPPTGQPADLINDDPIDTPSTTPVRPTDVPGVDPPRKNAD